MSGIIRCAWIMIVIGALGALTDNASTRAGSARLIPMAPRHVPIVIRERRNDSVTAARGAVTDVKGSWKVPSVDCSSSNQNQYASLWVGIDGYNSNTVEQIGTDSDCQGGVPTYYAWYEFFPHFSYLIDLGGQVGPGDVISAEVKSGAGGVFTVLLTDQSIIGQPFSTTAKMSSARRSSAEWIVEAPWSGGVLPLANFAIADFGNNYTGVGDTSTATIGPKTGPIGSFGSPAAPNSPVHEITMVTSGGADKAEPLGLSKDGSSFQVRWASSGP